MAAVTYTQPQSTTATPGSTEDPVGAVADAGTVATAPGGGHAD